MPITAVGHIVDSDGEPIVGRKIVLQALGEQGWTTLQEIRDGTVDVDLPGVGPGRGRGAPVPLRLVDTSTDTELVVSSDPMWTAGDEQLTADFGTLRLREEAVLRPGVVSTGERVIGTPRERIGTDDVRPIPHGIPELREELEIKTSELKNVRLDLSTALTRVEELTATLGTSTEIVDVIAGLGTQLSATNAQLATQTTPFRLAEVKIDLRGRLGTDGSTIVMDGANGGSGISADLVVDAPASTIPTQGVPSVQGLTASAAVRVLRSVGFHLDSATQQLPEDQGVPGQAITQQPAAGAVAEFGTTVLVVFGVRNESDE
ncbi:hypothetical protein CFK38_04125 [Brachybacterium vulturis]|uniref:PASTA domain-containing protein n=1 Tax=Brachybacterium vulturis TaxID=2017484 RepID=A0A291GL68_9MICO|nr:PASTA domain-containing protein [Brachybacterium vulturis]ATG50802.1 hypothetical protein CFK38_04125 [Brachybacterium vulturis]